MKIESFFQDIENETSLSNPFYLHHSDNTGATFVSHPLNGDNYPTWSCAMRIALSAKNKLGKMQQYGAVMVD